MPRMHIFTASEQKAFDTPPVFSDVERDTFFQVSEGLDAMLAALRGPTNRGRCLTGVDSRSKELSEFVAIDEESNYEIVHALRLGETNRASDEPLDPSP